MFPSLCYYGPSVAPFAGLKAIIGRSAVKDSRDNWWVWVVWEDGELSCETLDNLCRYVPTLKWPDVETLARSQPLFYYKTSYNQERRKVAPRSHWEGLSPEARSGLANATQNCKGVCVRERERERETESERERGRERGGGEGSIHIPTPQLYTPFEDADAGAAPLRPVLARGSPVVPCTAAPSAASARAPFVAPSLPDPTLVAPTGRVTSAAPSFVLGPARPTRTKSRDNRKGMQPVIVRSIQATN